jgi:hypothetical protein
VVRLPASRSQIARFTQSTTKKTAPKLANSPTFTASNVDQTRCRETELNQRLSV